MIRVSEPVITASDVQAVNEVLTQGWISSSGPSVAAFETEWSKFCGHKYGIACSSGTAALEACLAGYRFPKGANVILPKATIVSCAVAIYRLGLVPNYVDVDEKTWTLDPSLIEDAINEDTVAILSVDLFGTPSNYHKINQICSRNHIYHIIDAAESHGALFDGQIAHSYGDSVVFSFFSNKHITTGEGGMVVTSNNAVHDEVRKYINLYFDKERSYNHERLGCNFRMTNMQAALGLSQMQRMTQISEKKEEIYSNYKRKLQKRDMGLEFQKMCSKCKSGYWVVALSSTRLLGVLEGVQQQLFELGIETRRFFKPLDIQPFNLGQKYISDVGHNSQRLYDTGLYLPSGMGLSDDDMDFVIDNFTKVLRDA